MIRKVAFAVLSLGMLFLAAVPKSAGACPQICYYSHGHWVCGC